MFFQDDRFHPTADDDDYDYQPDDNSTIAPLSMTSSVSTKRIKRRRLLDATKLEDPGFHRIVHKMTHGKPVNIDIYSTNMTPGNAIRGAITGVRHYHCRVGSTDEYQFFKVSDCRSSPQVGREPNKEALILYFDTPDQYEKHMKSPVSAELKQQWNDRATRYRRKREMAQETKGDVVVK